MNDEEEWSSQPKGVLSDLRKGDLHTEEWSTERGVVGPRLEILVYIGALLLGFRCSGWGFGVLLGAYRGKPLRSSTH